MEILEKHLSQQTVRDGGRGGVVAFVVAVFLDRMAMAAAMCAPQVREEL